MATSDMYQQRYQDDGPPPYHPSAVKQWARRVISFSTQYDNTGWSADQALGPPKVYPNNGDYRGAWATALFDQNQFIELEFEIPVRPTAVNIYETYNAGAVMCVKAKDPKTNHWSLLWKTNAPTRLSHSRIFSPPLPDLASSLTISQLRIEIDCSLARNWCEIDAVELVGVRPGAVMPADDSQYMEDMKLLVNNQLHSDVQLQVDKRSVYAHKAILAARSPFFAKMFQNNKDPSVRLDLPNVSKEDLIATITFLYTNRVPSDCSTETLIALCKLSKTLEIQDLKTGALYRLTERLTCENVVNIFISIAQDPLADELKSMCINFMADHLKDMSLIPDFESLPQKYLVEVVQNATASMSTNKYD